MISHLWAVSSPSFELHICSEKIKVKDGINIFDSSEPDEGRALRHAWLR